ncbi:MAG TPA: hypothetical protein VMW27_25475 [Thermoanaerobaculia bacterium]|nr:hypothetical protein [Thermoanaerobaculia bacterium]
MTVTRSPMAGYLRFLVCVAAVVAILAGLGYVPTRHLGGMGAVSAMFAGCAIGAVASLAGLLPFVVGRGAATPAGRLQAMLLAMAVRFGVVLVLGLAASLSGWFERGPLLLWIAISYVALLAVETWFALKGFSQRDVETR